jgi:Cytochrome C oxidase, cbb3-type, subunit III
MRIGNELLTQVPRGSAGLRRSAAWLAVCLAIGASGCRRDMYDQPRYEAYEPSTFFNDGISSRPIIAGTVARDELRADSLYYQGKIDGKDANVFPFEIDAATLELGRERYMIFCTPCHGRLGDGKGMVARRGFSPPPTFHSEYLRKIEVSHFFNVMSKGYGAMYSYEARIPVRHRWAIAAYIRALQYSQNASPEDLNDADRKELAKVEAPATPTRDESKSPAEAHK